MNARAVASVESQGKCVQQSVDSFVQLTANPRRIPLPYETSGSAAPLSTDMKIDDYFRPCNQVNAETKVDELEVYDSCSAMFQYTAASNASSHSEESSLPPPVPVGNTSPLKSTSFQSDPYRSTLQISAPSNSALELPIPSTSVPKVLSPATKARIERNKEIALARRGQIISTANPLNQPSLPPALPPGTPAIISQKNNIPPIPTLCCPLEPSLCLQSFTFAASNTCDSRKLQNTSCIPDFSHNEKCASSSFTPAAGFQFTSGGGKTVTVSAEAMANVSATYKMTTPTTCSTNAFPAAQESLNGFLKTMPATNFNQGERVGRSID